MTNPNNPNFSYDIYGGIDEAVDTAFAANVAKASVPESVDVLAQAVVRGQIDPLISCDQRFRATTEVIRENTNRLFDRIGIDTPNLAEFAEAGIDFARLDKAYTQMIELNLEPQFILAPTLEVDQWKELFQALQDDPEVNNTDRIKKGGLRIEDSIVRGWDMLQGTEDAVSVGSNDWQVIVMPGTNRPPLTSITHRGTAVRKIDGNLRAQVAQLGIARTELVSGKLHPTIATYLTAQANNLQLHQNPMDDCTFTWLQGTFRKSIHDLVASDGCWYPIEGQVRLNYNEVGVRSSERGVRLSVRGNK